MKIAITIIAIALIVGGALAYIIYAKKSGQKCIGCPNSKSCSHSCGGCSCGCQGENSEAEKEK
ncbi:MAG: FeoB-associated Cys-rich membrane protein [Clostridia bacterium]|nr:FeoB-associated Cys-rich membrane protein [Clostridia bacterium]